MKTEQSKVTDLICGEKMFMIPVYQRNYDWKDKNCVQLFHDIERIAGTTEEHFLGTVVYTQGSGKYSGTAMCPNYIIIDGQQRLTSIILYAKALYDTIEDETIKSYIKDEFFENKKSKDEKFRIKLKPIKTDRNVFDKLINSSFFDETKLSDKERKSNIIRNYKIFKELLSKTHKPLEDMYSALFQLVIVNIILDKENPQMIFESLNSTGLDLQNTDLIRNYLLMSLDYEEQELLYECYWKCIEERLGDNIEQFMIYYLMLKNKSHKVFMDGGLQQISFKNLYAAFKTTFGRKLTNYDAIDNFLQEVDKYSEYYSNFLYEDKEYPKDILHQKLYELFYTLENSSAAITLMHFYDDYIYKNKINETQFLKIIDIFISYTFRCKISDYKNSSTQFFALFLLPKIDISKTGDDLVEHVWDIMTQGTGTGGFPTDDIFSNSLKTKSLYTTLRAKGTCYLLYKIEKFLHNEVPPFEDAQVEHVIPQTLSDKWIEYLSAKKDIDNYDMYLHTLGNLTLTKNNQKISNNIFYDKKQEYSKSNYTLTRKLSIYSDFTSVEIKQRAEEISKYALQIWTLPKKYNSRIKPLIGALRTFGTINAGDYEFSSPRKLIFYGEEILISDGGRWAELFEILIRKLFIKDKLLFLELLSNQPYQYLCTTKTAESSRYIELEDGLYMNKTHNTPSKIKYIQAVLELFSTTYPNIDDNIKFEMRN